MRKERTNVIIVITFFYRKPIPRIMLTQQVDSILFYLNADFRRIPRKQFAMLLMGKFGEHSMFNKNQIVSMQ